MSQPRRLTAAAAGTACRYSFTWRGSVTGYDAYGERVAATDGRGVDVADTHNATPDPQGITPTVQLNASTGSYTRQWGYDAQGDQTSARTPPITTLQPNGAPTTAPVTTSSAYDDDGELTSTTSANGNTTSYAYDQLGRQVRTTLPAVTLYDNTTTTPTMTTGYDGDGNAVRQTDAVGAVTTSGYDPLGRQISTTNPVSGTLLITYSATEQVAAQDAQGNVTISRYDGAGRLVRTTDPTGGVTQYGYDPVGNTIAITGGDISGNVTTLETRDYDAQNHVIADTVGGGGRALRPRPPRRATTTTATWPRPRSPTATSPTTPTIWPTNSSASRSTPPPSAARQGTRTRATATTTTATWPRASTPTSATTRPPPSTATTACSKASIQPMARSA